MPLKTYTLTCPDLDCEKVFTVSLEPKDLEDGADAITCPECGEEWEWDFDVEADTLELVGDDGMDLTDEELDDIEGPEDDLEDED